MTITIHKLYNLGLGALLQRLAAACNYRSLGGAVCMLITTCITEHETTEEWSGGGARPVFYSPSLHCVITRARIKPPHTERRGRRAFFQLILLVSLHTVLGRPSASIALFLSLFPVSLEPSSGRKNGAQAAGLPIGNLPRVANINTLCLAKTVRHCRSYNGCCRRVRKA